MSKCHIVRNHVTAQLYFTCNSAAVKFVCGIISLQLHEQLCVVVASGNTNKEVSLNNDAISNSHVSCMTKHIDTAKYILYMNKVLFDLILYAPVKKFSVMSARLFLD